MKKIAIKLIRFYQKVLKVIFNQEQTKHCKFLPTCSEYTIDAINKKGTIRGLLLGAYRILRCNPFSKGGYDPVK